MTPYEEGYRDGMEHLSKQADHINEQVAKVAQILTKAVFVHSCSVSNPKPNTRLWLILGDDIITTGYFIGGQYLADGGAYVTPTHWCFPPSSIAEDSEKPTIRRSIRRGDRGNINP